MTMFTVGWFGYGGHSWMAEQLREKLLSEGITLKTCHEYPNANVKYSPNSIFGFIDSVDVIILPARVSIEPAKSRNRLALAWSRKKACVIYPLPAYLAWAKDGENALVASGPDEMTAACKKLMLDRALADRLAAAGHAIAMKHMDPRNMVLDFLAALSGKPAISLIIPHYSPRLDYLTLAIESAKLQTGVDLEIIVSSSSPSDVSGVAKGCKVHQSQVRMSFSQAINAGLSLVRPESKYVMIGNDDVIYAQNAMEEMVKALGGRHDTIINPFSNCDKGWLHHKDWTITRADGTTTMLVPNMEISSFNEEDLAQIMKSWHSSGNVYMAPFCAFFSTLIPRPVLEAVGMLNEEYQNGGEDADFCHRARRLGFQCLWTEAARVFHFGGKTRKVSEEQDHDRHHREDRYNNSLLQRRWKNKRIAIWTGPAWEKWNLDSPDTSGIGGSEYCAIRLAEQFALDGNEVSMFGDHERETVFTENGGIIEMYPWMEYRPEQNYWDLFIASRNLSPITKDPKAGKCVVWTHDVWLMGTKEIPPFHLGKVDKFIVLSPWHREFFLDYHQVPANYREKVITIPNGSDIDRYNCDPDKKIYGKMMYSSSPDRGLDNLLYLLPFIRTEVPEIHLHVFYGFHNYDSAVRQRGDVGEIARLDALKALIKKSEEEGLITMHGRVSMKELAEHWKECYVWAYPTWFSETHCLTAKEAQASSTPMVVSNVGALQTTVGEYGIIVPGDPYSKDSRERVVMEVIKLHKDKSYWNHWSEKSRAGAYGFSWDDVFRKYWKPLLD